VKSRLSALEGSLSTVSYIKSEKPLIVIEYE